MPKTLIFAKDDSHADDIVQIVREEFGKGNDFAAKITYKTTGGKPDDLLRRSATRYNPRIVVTVDMIATGTDIKPLESVMFMRVGQEPQLLRADEGPRRPGHRRRPTSRPSPPTRTPKDHFVIVDAVGVTETDLVDTQPLERKPTVPLEKLLQAVAFGTATPTSLSSLAGRLARLDRQLTKDDREALEQLAGGSSLQDIARGIVDALDPDRQLEAAQATLATTSRPPTRSPQPPKQLLDAAVAPLATNPELRERHRRRAPLLRADDRRDLQRRGPRSRLLRGRRERARATVESFEQFIDEHKDEITALQILYSRPYAQRLTFREIKELANAIGRPPCQWTPETLWAPTKRSTSPRCAGRRQRVLTDIVSLVRFALHQDGRTRPLPRQVRSASRLAAPARERRRGFHRRAARMA